MIYWLFAMFLDIIAPGKISVQKFRSAMKIQPGNLVKNKEEVFVETHMVHLARFGHAVGSCACPGSLLRTAEQPVLSSCGEWAHCSFADVVGQRTVAVLQVSCKPFPVVQGIVDSLAQLGFHKKAFPFFLKPRLQRLQHGLFALQAFLRPLLRGKILELFLYFEQLCHLTNGFWLPACGSA